MAGSSKACPPAPGKVVGLQAGSPVVEVAAFRCSDMSFHPTRSIAEAHEANLVYAEMEADFRHTLKSEFEAVAMSDLGLDDGDYAVISMKLLKNFTITRKA